MGAAEGNFDSFGPNPDSRFPTISLNAQFVLGSCEDFNLAAWQLVALLDVIIDSSPINSVQVQVLDLRHESRVWTKVKKIIVILKWIKIKAFQRFMTV